MNIGKLPNALLQKLVLDKIKNNNKAVIAGAGVGEDCCAVSINKKTVVLSGDPITAAGRGAGTLAVHVTANDIAAAGGIPVCAVVTVLIPPSADMEDVEEIIDELTCTAAEHDIAIGGGHTEVTPSVNQIVLNVTMLGELIGENMISSANAKAGDAIIMSKAAAIEGTLILADDHAERLAGRLDGFDLLQIDCMRGCLSVLKEGRIGAVTSGVHAMHDVTEGGVIGAVIEMCEASGTGAVIDTGSIPVLPVTQKLCRIFDIDPRYFISSGSMIFTTDAPDILLEALKKDGIDGFIIGKVTDGGFIDSFTGRPLDKVIRDELYKLQENMV